MCVELIKSGFYNVSLLTFSSIYIYIYRQRERERERVNLVFREQAVSDIEMFSKRTCKTISPQMGALIPCKAVCRLKGNLKMTSLFNISLLSLFYVTG
jgi:hypothetical protein